MKIVQAPDQLLSQTAKPIEKIDKTLKELLRAMEETLVSQVDPEGVGLAAPQIGRSLQLFIVKQEPDAPVLTFINPLIKETLEKPKEKETEVGQNDKVAKVKRKEDKGVQLEGCLSLKDIWGAVKRPYGVILSYQDEDGNQHEKKFEGFLATIIQHEIDHLQGILFPKRVLEQKNTLYHSTKNKKGTIEFEEIEI
ncbi:MAG: peptide deformylase [Candidatus Levyibacteriota bacterium]